MKYLLYYFSSEEANRDKRNRPLVVYVNDIENIHFVNNNVYTGAVTLELLGDDVLIGYCDCTITVNADTTLPVYYTKDTFESETPDETLTLKTGDNRFYFDSCIYRIGIVEYDRTKLTRKSGNKYVTGIKIKGNHKNWYRMFDNASSYIPNFVSCDLTELDVSNIESFMTMFLYCNNLTTIGDLSNWNISNVTDLLYMFNLVFLTTSVGDLSNWNTSKVNNMKYMFCKNYALLDVGDLSNWDTSNVTNMACIFRECNNLTNIGDLSNWDVSNVEAMTLMFTKCYELTSVGDLSNWDVSNVSNMATMFWNCINLTSVGDLSNWKASNCTNAQGMFSCPPDDDNPDIFMQFKSLNLSKLFINGCIKDLSVMFLNCTTLTCIGDLSNWNTSNVTTMLTMFNSCYELTSVGDLSSWDVSNVINMSGMFQCCSKLTSVGDLSSWNTSKVTDMSWMFNRYYILTSVGDLSSWDVSNVSNMTTMFQCCYELTTIGDLSSWDISNVTNMSYMFNKCYNLASVGDLSNWNVSNVTNMSYMFNTCYELTSIGDISSWNVSKVTNMSGMFVFCHSLTYIGDISNWVTSNITYIVFKHCISLKQDLDVSKWDLSNFETLGFMFDTCSNLRLTGFKNWDVSKVTNMLGLFRKCISIDPDEFDFSSWDTSNVTNMWNIFSNRESGDGYIYSNGKLTVCLDGTIKRIKHFPMVPACSNGTATLICRYDWDLTTIEASNTISSSIAFAESPLTKESALVMLNALDASNPNTIKFSDYTYNLLSEDDIKIGTDKGWSVVKAEPIGKFKFTGSSVTETTEYGLKLTSNDDFTYTDLTVIFDDDVIATGNIENQGSYTFPVENNKVKNIINNESTGIDDNIVNMYMYTIEYNGKVYRYSNDF